MQQCKEALRCVSHTQYSCYPLYSRNTHPPPNRQPGVSRAALWKLSIWMPTSEPRNVMLMLVKCS